LTLEDEACARYSHALAAPLKKTQQTLLKSNALFALSQAANLWVIALVFWVGARWIAELRFDLNDFFVVLQSTVFAATQAGGVFAFVPDASHAQQSSTNVLRLLDQRPAIDIESETGRRVESSAQGHLRFNDVSFRCAHGK
jgi:ATP-binding cassette subfamily B (MDR/TAP) protein 1